VSKISVGKRDKKYLEEKEFKNIWRKKKSFSKLKLNVMLSCFL